MGELKAKNLRRPDDSTEFDHGRAEWVTVGDLTIGRTIAHPGWRWSEHIRPIVGGEWCRSRHVGIVVSGRLGVVLEDGTERVLEPDDVFDIPPGHDGFALGDEDAVTLEWSGMRGWLDPLESLSDRILATLVFTDIVDSTATAQRLGTSRWNDLLGSHNARMREIVARHRGREVKTTGERAPGDVRRSGASRAVCVEDGGRGA